MLMAASNFTLPKNPSIEENNFSEVIENSGDIAEVISLDTNAVEGTMFFPPLSRELLEEALAVSDEEEGADDSDEEVGVVDAAAPPSAGSTQEVDGVEGIEAVETVKKTAAEPARRGPSGPRKAGEGTEEEEQGVLSVHKIPGGGVQLRVTLLAAGFVIGASGASVREIMQQTGACIQSWSEGANARVTRPTRVFRLQGPRKAVANAAGLIKDAVERYKELCEGKRRGEYVQRQQRIRGVEFAYQPPPRSAQPQAAALGTNRAASAKGATVASKIGLEAATPAPDTGGRRRGGRRTNKGSRSPGRVQQGVPAVAGVAAPAGGLLLGLEAAGTPAHLLDPTLAGHHLGVGGLDVNTAAAAIGMVPGGLAQHGYAQPSLGLPQPAGVPAVGIASIGHPAASLGQVVRQHGVGRIPVSVAAAGGYPATAAQMQYLSANGVLLPQAAALSGLNTTAAAQAALLVSSGMVAPAPPPAAILANGVEALQGNGAPVGLLSAANTGLPQVAAAAGLQGLLDPSQAAALANSLAVGPSMLGAGMPPAAVVGQPVGLVAAQAQAQGHMGLPRVHGVFEMPSTQPGLYQAAQAQGLAAGSDGSWNSASGSITAPKQMLTAADQMAMLGRGPALAALGGLQPALQNSAVARPYGADAAAALPLPVASGMHGLGTAVSADPQGFGAPGAFPGGIQGVVNAPNVPDELQLENYHAMAQGNRRVTHPQHGMPATVPAAAAAAEYALHPLEPAAHGNWNGLMENLSPWQAPALHPPAPDSRLGLGSALTESEEVMDKSTLAVLTSLSHQLEDLGLGEEVEGGLMLPEDTLGAPSYTAAQPPLQQQGNPHQWPIPTSGEHGLLPERLDSEGDGSSEWVPPWLRGSHPVLGRSF
ncbi:hypothetical protein CYMTET_53956 [Cymbomonas tetramitiformis]|uniref:K Homology domain-containing protein n=1 Tax=Cymbomonas tetramitiformis TaxID=36881 RepID=A0AAE0BFU9_9CHLO|nr:hypothetical protein CYMTET_53956 [Cymbomonas tetramitiformis]